MTSAAPRLLRARAITDAKAGVLRVLDPLPFVVRRLFWLDVPCRASRGGHAHRTNWQLVAPARGVVTARCQRYVRSLLRSRTWQLVPGMALVVPPLVWLDLRFVDDGVCVVLASEPYCAAEYITDKTELRRLS